MVTAEEAAPAFSLARFVEEVSAVVPVAGRACHERLPDGRTTLIFRVLEEGQRGDVAVAGPRTRALFKKTDGVGRAMIVQLKPGWSAQLFGVAASALTDQIVLLEELWGLAGGELSEELLATGSVAEAMERIGRAIALRLPRMAESSSARLARRAVQLLEGGEVQVERVASRLGVTARHLRRAFTESIGIAPKDFVRTTRLQRAVKMATTSTDWARIAVAAGYYDQSHLIADFRDLVGLTPGAFSRMRGSAQLASGAARAVAEARV